MEFARINPYYNSFMVDNIRSIDWPLSIANFYNKHQFCGLAVAQLPR